MKIFVNLKKQIILIAAGILACMCLQLSPSNAAPDLQANHFLEAKSAIKSTSPKSIMMLAVAQAGKNIVAVGDYGNVLISDADRKTFHQAASVPVRSLLTSVFFADDQHGWAVGHRGVIIATEDGGEHWHLLRQDTSVDQPLFSVYFKDKQAGWACGLWSLLLTTHDAGKTWQKVDLPVMPDGKRADLNLYAIFGDNHGHIYATAEQGKVLISSDEGLSWQYSDTGFKGSLWSGLAYGEDKLLVGGLRGALYGSNNAGKDWEKLDSRTLSSLTAMTSINQTIYLAGLDGVMLDSSDNGAHFNLRQNTNRLPFTAIILNKANSPVYFSKQGLVN